MKKILIVAAMILVAITALAGGKKDGKSISGKVTDNEGEPLAFANVLALRAIDSTFIAGTTTDTLGVFTLEAPTEGTLLLVSLLGYEDVYVAAGISEISLSRSSLWLDGAGVTATIPQHTMTSEGLQTDVAGTMLSRLGTAEDVMGHLPGVMKTDEGWEVFGRGTSVIYLNGREVHELSELDEISSGEVKNVEVIRNPGAKYSASTGAVIRIRTARRQGEGFGLDARSSYSFNKYNSLTGQLNTHYRRGGLYLFGMYMYSADRTATDAAYDFTVSADTLWQQHSDEYTAYKTVSHKFQAGFSYDLGERHSFGIRYNGTVTSKEWGRNSMESIMLSDGNFYDALSSSTYSPNDDHPVHWVNSYYSGELGKTSIEFNSDIYFKHVVDFSDTRENSQEYNSYELSSESHNRSHFVAAKLALSTPIYRGTLNYGIEYTNTYNDYSYESNLPLIVADSHSKVRENAANLFVEYSLGTRVGMLQAGLRYEYVGFDYYEDNVKIDEQSRTFSNLFPSVSLSTRLGQTSWQLSYSVKTLRPEYSKLSSNISYTNRFTRKSGNPQLTHETNHTVSLTGLWKYVVFSLQYVDSRNAIIYWADQDYDSEAITTVRYRNQKSVKSLTPFVSIAPKIGMWAPQMSVGVHQSWLSLDTDTGKKKLNKPHPFVTFNNGFSLPAGITANLDFTYEGKGNAENVLFLKSNYILGVGVSKSFLEDALTVELKGSDLLNQKWEAVELYTTSFQLDQLARFHTRAVTLTLRYKFNTSRSRYRGTGAGSSEIDRL